jgi:hypothetical protein
VQVDELEAPEYLKTPLTAYLTTLAALLGIDFIWLSLANERLYRPILKDILVDGFLPAYADTKPRKTPTWFVLNEERPLYAFAGLRTPWRGVRSPKIAPVEGHRCERRRRRRALRRNWRRLGGPARGNADRPTAHRSSPCRPRSRRRPDRLKA